MTDATHIRTVAVVGTGTIGSSWALIFSKGGLETRVFDEDPAQLASLEKKLDEGLKLLSRVGRLKADDFGWIKRRIVPCPDLATVLEGADYVQESAPEDLALKQGLFAELDARTPPTTIIASSVSALSITAIAEKTRYPGRCLAVHPTNPPHVVPLVEIVGGENTAPQVVRTAYAFMKQLGQEPVICKKEIYGYVLNRLQFALVREALYLAREGVASIEDIDKCIHHGLGLRWAFMGPFGVAETNAATIEAYLTKFNAGIRNLVADVCRPYEGPGLDDIQMAARGVREMFPDRTHDELLAYRDEMVLRLREIKERNESQETEEGNR